jgi:hypothetical protein
LDDSWADRSLFAVLAASRSISALNTGSLEDRCFDLLDEIEVRAAHDLGRNVLVKDRTEALLGLAHAERLSGSIRRPKLSKERCNERLCDERLGVAAGVGANLRRALSLRSTIGFLCGRHRRVEFAGE